MTSTGPWLPPAGLRARSGARCVRASGRSTCSGSLASSRSGTGAGRAREPRQRQADQRVPRRRRAARRGALLLLRGLGRQARVRRLRARPPSDRRSRPGHPVELPAAHGRMEARPGARDRQHVRAEAGRDDAAVRARALPRSSSRRTCRPASSTSSPVHGATGAALVAHPGVDKVAFTGSTKVGKEIQQSVAGTSKRLTLELGGKAANIVFEDAPDRRGHRGHRQRDLLQPGPGLLRRVAPFGAGVSRRGGAREAQAAAPDAAARRPARQEHRHRRHQLVGAAGADTTAVRRGRGRGCRTLVTRHASCPSGGTGSRPRSSPVCRPAHRIAREEIFGPVLSVLTFRTPEEAVAKANNTTYGLSAGVWTEKGSRILWMAGQLRAGVVWANTFNRFDPTSPFGGYQRVGLRQGGRSARAGGVPRCLRSACRCARPTSSTSEGPSRVRSPAARTPWPSADGGFLANAALGVEKRRPGRRRRGAQGHAGLGERDRVQPGPGSLPCGGDAGRSAVPVHRRGERRPRGPARSSLRRASTQRSTAGSGMPAGPTRWPRSPGPPTRSPGRSSTSASPSRPASWACSRRRRPRFSGSSASWRPCIATGNTTVVVASETRPLPAISLDRGAGHLRHARWCREPPHRPDRPSSRRYSPRTATSTPSTWRARPPTSPSSSSGRRRRT